MFYPVRCNMIIPTTQCFLNYIRYNISYSITVIIAIFIFIRYRQRKFRKLLIINIIIIMTLFSFFILTSPSTHIFSPALCSSSSDVTLFSFSFPFQLNCFPNVLNIKSAVFIVFLFIIVKTKKKQKICVNAEGS